MELNDVIRTTFSARDFTDEDLPDQVLHEILDTARFAPSGGNRQGNRVIVVRDAGMRDQLAKCAEPAAKRYTAQILAGESPWNSIVPTTVTAEIAAETTPPDRLVDSFRIAPVVLVFVVDLKLVASTDKELERVGVISGASVYPFVWNVLLCARQAGLGGTITTLAVAEEPAVRQLLGIPADHAVAAVVPMGRPVRMLTKLRRNTAAEIATHDRFDGPPFGGQ